jgi:hypothetical protein
MFKFTTILASIIISSFGYTTAQTSTIDLYKINDQRLQLNQSGMAVLGGWAAVNMIVGGIGMTQSTGNVRYFHQFNLAWNSVNLAIAGLGYVGAQTTRSDLSLTETIREYQAFENILLFNAGIDIGYMATGAYLWERGLRKESDRLTGYGQSLILQGAFLFTFDLIMFIASRKQNNSLLNALNDVSIQPTGISYRLQF